MAAPAPAAPEDPTRTPATEELLEVYAFLVWWCFSMLVFQYFYVGVQYALCLNMLSSNLPIKILYQNLLVYFPSSPSQESSLQKRRRIVKKGAVSSTEFFEMAYSVKKE